jgi:hypothetical protein
MAQMNITRSLDVKLIFSKSPKISPCTKYNVKEDAECVTDRAFHLYIKFEFFQSSSTS